jgi:transposase
MTMVEGARVIAGGVDAHAGLPVAAALDRIGGLLGVREFPAAAAGYAGLPGWLGGFGDIAVVGAGGTGGYGAGLARHLAAAGVRVAEVDRADRQDRHRAGRSGPLDAVSAARAARSGRASGAAKGRDGQVEAIRALMVARRSARASGAQAVNQARALILTGPGELRARFAGHTPAALAAAIAARRAVSGRPAASPGRAGPARWSPPARRACSRCLAPARIPPRCCWPPPGITRSGCAARARGRTCAASRRSLLPRARSPAGTGSTAAATAKPARRCGGS